MQLERDAGIGCSADGILITSGSLQALDLINDTLLARGDTVIIEEDFCQENSRGRIGRRCRFTANKKLPARPLPETA